MNSIEMLFQLHIFQIIPKKRNIILRFNIFLIRVGCDCFIDLNPFIVHEQSAFHQGKQPKAIQFSEDGKRSSSPSQNLLDIAQRRDTYDSLCQPEELSPKSYELRVHVTFGKGTKGGMHNEGVN